jgi:acyl-CoA synthetase (AMP-forming)/AMP-acid ligase II
MIITAGFNIFPSDIEAVLLRHPNVLEAAVVGVASGRLGEVPVAFAAVRDSSATSASDLCRWLNARLNDKQRVYSVKVIDKLPRNAAGKTLKSELLALTGAKNK